MLRRVISAPLLRRMTCAILPPAAAEAAVAAIGTVAGATKSLFALGLVIDTVGGGEVRMRTVTTCDSSTLPEGLIART